MLIWHNLLHFDKFSINMLSFIWKKRYQRGNQNPEEHTIQWPKEKEQKDKQGFTKHYTKN
jgi:hypothetical protein